MNRELVDKLRLDAGIVRLTAEWDQALICVGRDGKVIDPLVGLALFAKLIVEECCMVIDEYGEDIENGDVFANRFKKLGEDIKAGHLGPVAWEASEQIKNHFGVLNEQGRV